MVQAFVKLVLSFAPWISFLIIARDTVFRVKLGLVVALVLSVVMSVARLHRGIIMWVGLLFFGYATVAVVFLDNMWTLRYLGVMANGALAGGSWATIAFGRPFSLEYAREHTDPALWTDPAFIRSNVIITAGWATTFTANTLLAWGKMAGFLIPAWGYETVSYILLVGTAAFTAWYPTHVRRRRLQAAA